MAEIIGEYSAMVGLVIQSLYLQTQERWLVKTIAVLWANFAEMMCVSANHCCGDGARASADLATHVDFIG